MIKYSCEEINETTLCLRFAFSDDINPDIKESNVIDPHRDTCLTTDTALPIRIAKIREAVMAHYQHVIQDYVCAYNSLLLIYDITAIDSHVFILAIKQLIDNELTQQHIPSSVLTSQHEMRTHHIPTYYGTECGWDLHTIAVKKKCSIAHIIQRHTETPYTVCAIGFIPGFAYCGFVDDAIASPRLTTPRQKVLAGSVGIADNQTGIYPCDSPGGWNIIGRTLFQTLVNFPDLAHSHAECIFHVGDTLKFEAITRDQFLRAGGIL